MLPLELDEPVEPGMLLAPVLPAEPDVPLLPALGDESDEPIEPEDPDEPPLLPLEPEVPPLEPDVPPLEPEVPPVEPEVPPLEPEVPPVEPDVLPLEPEAPPVEPEVPEPLGDAELPEVPEVPALSAWPPREVLLLPIPVDPLVLDGEPPVEPRIAPDELSFLEFFSEAEVLLDEPAWPAPLVALLLPPVEDGDDVWANAAPVVPNAETIAAINSFFI